MKNIIYIAAILFLLSACGNNDTKQQEKNFAPIVSNGGQTISFTDAETISFFKTEKVTGSNITAEFAAPAKIAATVVSSTGVASQNIVLFENPDLTSNYSQFIQHQSNISQIQNVNIKQKRIELGRIKDLQQHGAATGKELLEAQTALAMEQTNLSNEKAALIEHEARLQVGGFNPEILRKVAAGTAYIICDIPENQINKIKEGDACSILFLAFPNEKFTGKTESIADVVDSTTRMLKARIIVNNSNGKLKTGMFATVSFGLSEGDFISVGKNALVTVQGRNYVFVKTNSNTFERKEIHTGLQIDDRIIVYSGLSSGDEAAVQGVMQLKGLSFGY